MLVHFYFELDFNNSILNAIKTVFFAKAATPVRKIYVVLIAGDNHFTILSEISVF